MHLKRFILVLGLTALLSACAGHIPKLPGAESLVHLPPSVLIDSVIFHAQDAYQCGPAALAMMFNHRGLAASPETLKDRVYLPQRRGSLQVEMVAAARGRDLLVYPLARNLETILAELNAGNPVLVLQNLAFNWRPQWHYAVVIGYDLPRRELIVHSGLNPAQREPFKVFMHTWSRGDYWGRVLLPAGKLPATAEPLIYLRAASDLEETGRLDSAKKAYATALEVWPEQPTARFGLANIAWSQNRKEEAVEDFRLLAKEFPHFKAAWHNLSVGLEVLGCTQAAQVAKACANDEPSPVNIPLPSEVATALCSLPVCPQ